MSTWLNDEVKKRNWSIRKFGQVIGVSHTHAARLVNGDVRPSLDLCAEIARAFDIRPEDVMKLAGILPPEPVSQSSITKEIDRELAAMTEEELCMWRDTLRGFNEQRGRRGGLTPVVAGD
jgi:transcriptional regulator with XRE-family HTH domain